jgi:type II secretory pathway pseudopilin PulG
MQRRRGTLRADAGIAIGPILFMIAILGILAAAISAGSGQFSNDTTNDSAKAAAQAIIDYGEQMQNGVDLMLGRGIDPLNLSFTHNFLSQNGSSSLSTWFMNTNCTPAMNGACELFSLNGGGVVSHDFHIYGHIPQTIWQPTWAQTGSVDFYVISIDGLGTANSGICSSPRPDARE